MRQISTLVLVALLVAASETALAAVMPSSEYGPSLYGSSFRRLERRVDGEVQGTTFTMKVVSANLTADGDDNGGAGADEGDDADAGDEGNDASDDDDDDDSSGDSDAGGDGDDEVGAKVRDAAVSIKVSAVKVVTEGDNNGDNEGIGDEGDDDAGSEDDNAGDEDDAGGFDVETGAGDSDDAIQLMRRDDGDDDDGAAADAKADGAVAGAAVDAKADDGDGNVAAAGPGYCGPFLADLSVTLKEYTLDLKPDQDNKDAFAGKEGLVVSNGRMVVSGAPGIFDGASQSGPMYTLQFGRTCSAYLRAGIYCTRECKSSSDSVGAYWDCSDPKSPSFGTFTSCRVPGGYGPRLSCISQSDSLPGKCATGRNVLATAQSVATAQDQRPCDYLADAMSKLPKGSTRAFCIGARSDTLLICPGNKARRCAGQCVSLFEDAEMTTPCGKAACDAKGYWADPPKPTRKAFGYGTRE